MANKTTKSESEKQYYAAYNPEQQRNARLERHMKKHPNDTQAKKATKSYRRKTPNNKGGWMTRQMCENIDLGHGAIPPEEMSYQPPVDQKLIAQYSSFVKAVRNQAQFESKKNAAAKNPQLGYAEEVKRKAKKRK